MSASRVRRGSNSPRRRGSNSSLHGKSFTDPGLDISDLAGSLSPFQIEKLSYLFKCLDQNGSGFIDVKPSILIERIQLKISISG